MAQAGKISTDGGSGLGQNPFAALSAAGLPAAPTGRGAGLLRPSSDTDAKRAQQACAPTKPSIKKDRGRVDIVRETGGRGGKTVTVAGKGSTHQKNARRLRLRRHGEGRGDRHPRRPARNRGADPDRGRFSAGLRRRVTRESGFCHRAHKERSPRKSQCDPP